MIQDSEKIKEGLEMNKLSVLIIIFLMAAVIFFLFLLMSADKALADPEGGGMRLKLGHGKRSYVNVDLTREQSAKKRACILA